LKERGRSVPEAVASEAAALPNVRRTAMNAVESIVMEESCLRPVMADKVTCNEYVWTV
jgi:hypothetical protein